MHPLPNTRKEDLEKDIVIICSFEEAKMISEPVKKAYPKYDFWSVSKSFGDAGLYVGAGLDDVKYAEIHGYAKAILDVLKNITKGIS
jgi:hypothetical protein